jgi:hypothetical protein
MIAVLSFTRRMEESPGSRKQGVQRKLERLEGPKGFLLVASLEPQKLCRSSYPKGTEETSEKRQSSPLQPPNGTL